MVPSFMLPGSGLDAVNTRGVEIPRSAKLKAPSIPVHLTINRRCVSTVLKTELRSTSGPRICVFILDIFDWTTIRPSVSAFFSFVRSFYHLEVIRCESYGEKDGAGKGSNRQ